MINNGEEKLIAIFIVAVREKFTPCGTWLDWIFQFGGPDTLILTQNHKESDIKRYSAKELMPHYPS